MLKGKKKFFKTRKWYRAVRKTDNSIRTVSLRTHRLNAERSPRI